jgi:hypothetical protein
MARLFRRGAGPIGIALTTWELWRRLPPEYRRQIVRATRKHGPRILAELRRLKRDLSRR